MTISMSDFGFTCDQTTFDRAWLVLPCVEAPAKWNDAIPSSGRYHRHRARAHVDIASGEEMTVGYRLTNSSATQWFEYMDSEIINNDWTSSYSAAGETGQHPNIDNSTPVPNTTIPDNSHRYVVAKVMFRKHGSSADVEMNAVEFGWPHDTAIAAGQPDITLGDRTGAHVFDSYYSASSWHITRNLLGNMQRMLYESVWRITTVMSNRR